MPPTITRDIKVAADALRAGRLVAMPTETVYGLAAPIADAAAVRAVFELKERPLFDPLIVHVAGEEDARNLVATWPEEARVLAERFWPGPLSIVLEKADSVDPLITAGLDTVAVRCPDHTLARELIAMVGPLAAPSANRFGRTSPTSPNHVVDEFPNADDLVILDGDECEGGIESTVVRIDQANRCLELLRPGLITPGDLSKALFDAGLERDMYDLSGDFSGGAKSGVEDDSLPAPGMLRRHYQPRRPLVIVRAESDADADHLRQQAAAMIGANDTSKIVEMNLNGSPLLAARTLYALMREAAEREGVEAMFVRRTPERSGEAWNAIWNRLERAASAVVGC